MVDCEYCYRPLEAGANNNEYHNVCSDEWEKRHKTEICVCCGVLEIPDGYKYYCIHCADGEPFLNYPGPQ